MPQLKQIEASIELGTSNTKLKEYGARYSDGHVETFIAVPNTDMPFSLHLTTKGYIAPGISFFVFMDGEYQCNRNKIGLRLPGDRVQPNEYETDFRLRQKEEKTSAGSFVAREWSFAKLDKAAADKAPSLNLDFIRNLGTIEVVAMRCRPASEEMAQRQISSQVRKSDTGVPKARSRVKSAKQASFKTPTEPALAEDGGILGFMFGMDGANDEQRIFDDGRVNPNPPPGFSWDAGRGEYKQTDAFASSMPGAFPDQEAQVEPHGHETAKDFVARFTQEKQAAQLDGPGEWPSGYQAGYSGRRRDDLRGERYLGMNGRDRSDYKQCSKERGDTVSQTPRPVIGIGLMEGFICNTQAAVKEIQGAPPVAKDSARFLAASQDKGYYEHTPAGMRLFASDLEAMRQDLLEQNRKNPRLNTAEAWRDWRLMEARFHGMRAERPCGQSQHGHQQVRDTGPSPAQQDALDDIYGLRMELRIASQIYPGLDISTWLAKLTEAESQLKSDPIWVHQEFTDEAAHLSARRAQLSWRNQLLTKVVDAFQEMDPKYIPPNLEERVESVRQEGLATSRRMRELRTPPPGTSQTQGLLGPDAARHVNFRQGYDGAPSQRNGTPMTPNQDSFWNNANTGNGADWQEMGAGSVKPGQQIGTGWSAPRQQSTHEHFAGQNLNNANDWKGEDGGQKSNGGWEQPAAADIWGAAQKSDNAGPASQAGSRRDQNQWASGSHKGSKGWTGADQNNDAWPKTKTASDARSATGWGAEGSKRGSKAGWDEGSQQGSHKTGDGDNWASAGGGDGSWGAQSNKSQGNSGGWGSNDQQRKDRSAGNGSSRGSTASGPKELVKPYWKHWDKLADSVSGSQADSAKRREVAREVYTYPAAKLPAIPEGKAAGATHGVQTGRGAEYNHLCRRPIYIDTLEKPYAVFSFKYRSKEKLKQITGLKVKSIDEDVKFVQKQVQKEKLIQMPKDQLIEQLMKSSGSKGGRQKAPSASGGQGWGDKPASNPNGWDQKSKTKIAAGNGWNTQNGTGGNGWGAQSNGGGSGWGVSNHSKSKKSADQWAANDNGGDNHGWDGQNEAAEAKLASRTPGEATPGGFKFDYDAFGLSDDGKETRKTGPSGNGWEREVSSSIFEDPYGDLWKGAEKVGRRSWAGSNVRAL